MWSFDMSAAPRDGTKIWAAPRDVSKQPQWTYWAKAKTPRGGWWAGFKSDGSADPIAWALYVVPAHPGSFGPVVQPMHVDTGSVEFMSAVCGEGSY